MEAIKSKLSSTIESLKQQRDELRVQMNLASAEAKDEWAKTEAKLELLEKKVREKKNAITEAVSESSEDVTAAFQLMTSEISKAFENIKKKLQ